MTVLILKKKYSINSKSILDDAGGVSIQRYDLLKYKQFDKLTEKTTWVFGCLKEIDLTKIHLISKKIDRPRKAYMV